MANSTESETSPTSAQYRHDEGELQALFEQYKSEEWKSDGDTSMAGVPPVDELEHAAAFVTVEQQKLEHRARTLLREVLSFSQAIDKADESSVSSMHLEPFKEQAKQIHHSCVHINQFAVKSIKKYFCDLGVERRNSKVMLPVTTPWTYIQGGTQIVTILSDCYQVIRSIEHDNAVIKQEWVVPSSFERVTKKYCINQGFLVDVLLFCVSELPLLIYGKSGLITDLHGESSAVAITDNDIWQYTATRVSSIYFDSPGMSLYGSRVARMEGATLFRVRWYGEKRPHGDQLLFLELKTHHESWTWDKSVKQRVSLRERDMTILLARDGAEWDTPFVENLIHLATPTLQADDLREAVRLLYQIRKLILKNDLRPCVRTSYLRMAFQSTDSNARRLTIDRDIIMSDESKATLGQWCTPENVSKTIDTVKVPNAILEVKLAKSDDSGFVNELLQIGAILDGHKFSKYLTGAMKLHSDKIKTMPYWAALPLFDELFGRKVTKPEEPPVLAHGKIPSSKMTSRRPSSVFRRHSPLLSLKSRSTLPSTQQDLVQFQARRVKVEPKTYFVNERTYIQWVSVSLLLVTIATLLLGIAVEEGLNTPRKMSMTLIFAALFIAAYAFVVYFRRLYLLTNGLPYGYIDHVGPVILTASVLMGIVGLMYYGFTITMSPSQAIENTSYTVATADSLGECTRHIFSGISLLEYQPSDVVLDKTSKILIIPSQSKLTGLPLDYSGEQQIIILGEVPGTDIEAITYAQGMLYAISESKGSSSLMAFESRLVGTRTFLDLVAQWILEGRSFTEGMAYVPDDMGGKLYITDGTDTTGEDSHVYVYDVPTIATNNESIDPVFQLNGKVLTSGIINDPKMGSMTFFEDVLYILHDNARVVRGWNLKSGAMISEWTLPRVEGGFDQQWEGLTLERVSSMGRNMAQGEPDPNHASSVVLHLTLDSPPQIWSFKLKETERNYTLPDCAAAY